MAEGRDLSVEDVRKIADGRVFTGNQALELSLIDTIGTFDDAIAIAANIADIKGKPKRIEIRNDRRSIFDMLFSGIQKNIGSRMGVEPAYRWQ